MQKAYTKRMRFFHAPKLGGDGIWRLKLPAH